MLAGWAGVMILLGVVDEVLPGEQSALGVLPDVSIFATTVTPAFDTRYHIKIKLIMKVPF
jgi:hypothetical protein